MTALASGLERSAAGQTKLSANPKAIDIRPVLHVVIEIVLTLTNQNCRVDTAGGIVSDKNIRECDKYELR